jgi:mono/diheme cytochrome c family protein
VRRALLLLGLAAGCAEPVPPGDPARGEVLHRSCLQCHETELYVPPKRKVQSLEQLRKETVRWGGMYNPGFTPAEVEDLVAYLNRDFYRFPPEPPKR